MKYTLTVALVAITFLSASVEARRRKRKPKWDPATHDYSVEPSRPIFRRKDKSECREAIDEHYDWAKSTYDANDANENRLNDSYETILAWQAWGISLIDNAAFKEWTMDGWEDSLMNTSSTLPEWTPIMVEVFGAGAEPIKTVDEVNDAVRVLFRWRS